MRAGRRDRRVTVQVKQTEQSSSGEEVEVWVDLHKLWMSKRDVRAAERFAADQVVAEVDTVFEALWAPALLEIRPDTHRLVFGRRAYQVQGVVEIDRRKSVEIACTARAEAKFGD